VARYTKPNQTIYTLRRLVEDYNGLYDLVNANNNLIGLISKIQSHGAIDYASRYYLPGGPLDDYDILNDSTGRIFPIVWCVAEGAYRLPIIFILYIDENGILQAYIPSKGNAYDHKLNIAYDRADRNKWKFNEYDLVDDIQNEISVWRLR